MAVTLADSYRSLYFLSALGAGGLSVSLFMYPMFLVKHPDTPIPTYEDVERALRNGDWSGRVLLVSVLVAMAALAVFHLYLLVGNLVATAGSCAATRTSTCAARTVR